MTKYHFCSIFSFMSFERRAERIRQAQETEEAKQREKEAKEAEYIASLTSQAQELLPELNEAVAKLVRNSEWSRERLTAEPLEFPGRTIKGHIKPVSACGAIEPTPMRNDYLFESRWQSKLKQRNDRIIEASEFGGWHIANQDMDTARDLYIPLSGDIIVDPRFDGGTGVLDESLSNLTLDQFIEMGEIRYMINKEKRGAGGTPWADYAHTTIDATLDKLAVHLTDAPD